VTRWCRGSNEEVKGKQGEGTGEARRKEKVPGKQGGGEKTMYTRVG
jgi:hypothetical protein